MSLPAGEGVALGESVQVKARSGASGFEPLTVVGLVDLEGQPDLRSSLPMFVTEEQLWAWAPEGAGGEVRVAAVEGVDDDELLGSLRAGLEPLDGSGVFTFATGAQAGDRLASTFMGARSMYVTVLYAFTLVTAWRYTLIRSYGDREPGATPGRPSPLSAVMSPVLHATACTTSAGGKADR